MEKTKSTNVGYVGNNWIESEVQFDTHDLRKLQALWWDYCIDEGILLYAEKVIADYMTGMTIEEKGSLI